MDKSQTRSDAGIKAFFLYYLGRLENLVELAVDNNRPDAGSDSLLYKRLAPDMFPFIQQVSTAAGFSLRALCPLVGVGAPDFGQPKTVEQLRQLIDRASCLLQELPEELVLDLESGSVSVTAGIAERCFTGWEYLYLYAVPNFLFHYSMAYAILRENGVPLGKRDFDGFHDYPPGFGFDRQ